MRKRYSFSWQVVLTVHMNGSEADEEVMKGHLKQDSWCYRRIKQIEKQVLSEVDKLVFVSAYAKNEVLKRYPQVNTKKTIIIPNGAGGPSDLDYSPADSFYSCCCFNLISIGSLDKIKNHVFLLEVIANLIPEFPQLRLFIVGRGELRGFLEKEISRRRLRHCVQIVTLKSQERLLAILKTAYLNLHCSFLETSSYSVIEAMSFGIPTVAFSSGGIGEIIRHGRTGFLVEKNDSQTFSHYVKLLLKDKGLYEKMRCCCRETFLREFDYRLMGRRYLDFYFS